MNKIQEVKNRVNIVDVARYFGLNLNRAYKCLCPFHKEKSPSFSVSPDKQIFKCFGCDESGDCITLVSKLLNINAYESAKQINNIFSLGINFNGSTSKYELNRYKQKQETKKRFEEWENKTFQLLCDYLHSLNWVEKHQEEEKLDYFINIFIYGTDEDKLWFKKTNERWCKKIEARLRGKNIRRVSTV